MKPIVFILFIAFHLTAIAQEGFKGEHFIEVSGSAEMEIEPNEIILSIRLREFEENKQKISLEKIEGEFLDAIKASGIDRKKLELAGGGSTLERISKKEKDAFREKSYKLTLSSAAELERFIEKLEPVKVQQVFISRLDHTDKERIRLDLKVKALQAAKTKAETLLKSIGGEIGKPLMVRESDHGDFQPLENMRMMSNVGVMGGATEDSDDASIGFRKIKFREQVIAQFEIK